MNDKSVHCAVTSPPYFGLRDYGMEGQMGLEQTPDEYVAGMVAVFREVRRVLRDDGTLWLNLGDSYAANRTYQVASTKGGPKHSGAQGKLGGSHVPDGLKPKDLIGIPWRVVFALQADGWYLRQDIIWHKPNPMPESVRDRCTKAHEYIFMLSKSARYYFDAVSIKETAAESSKARWPCGTTRVNSSKQGFDVSSGRGANSCGVGEKRNRRSVWTVSTKPFKGAHFATFPPDLIEPCILAGCPPEGTVLDPFGGAGTTGLVAKQHGRNAILLELNPDYAAMARERIDNPPAATRKREHKPDNDNSPDLFQDTAS
ncbi:site-specific DNA-methyltransferase [Pseudaminobacter arsenicus]|uniref:Methyltransferase n=2 Tax=Borborobacter arsenicus TaxID=1851146 RepID=A0A432VAN1_9HYPH|nr:site-specific DNA-methyltransferase [Pseudaminobacter arsenicus]